MRTCPQCSQEIPDDEAVTCPNCGGPIGPAPSAEPGAAGWAAMPQPQVVPAGAGGPTPVPSLAPMAPAPPVFTHSGERYVLGYDADVYGIWDRQFPQTPVQRFARSDQGWAQAWGEFSRLEPGAVPVGSGGTAGLTQGQAPIPRIAVATKTNSMAVAALITAILFIPIVPLILGYISRKEIDRSEGAQEGRGMATAGIVLGWINLVLVTLAVLAVITFVSVFGDQVVNIIEQDADARTMLSNALVEVQGYEQTHDSLDGLAPDKLPGSSIEWNELTYPVDGAVSIRDVGQDRVLLVTRTNIGMEYCVAMVDGQVTYGNTNPSSAEDCTGDWVFDWSPPE